MSDLMSWPRPSFEPGGGDANLFFKLHGDFTSEPTISRSRHRTRGVPAGCELTSFSLDEHPDVHGLGLDGYLGEQLRREDPRLFTATSSTDQCLVLRGDVEDPANLDYLRDAVGLVTALLQSGGVSVFDPHQFRWWSPADWHREIFEPAAAVPRHHAVILVSDEPQGRWYHTRGMLKFGRPDLSIHHVPKDLEPAVEDLCNRFMEMLAFGAVVPDGQPIKMKSLPEGWVCRHRGSLDDPDFNNRHLEIGPA